MTDEQDTPVEESAFAATDAPLAADDSSASEPQSPGDVWKEVGSQFQALGAAIKAGATSPEVKQVKTEAGKTLETFRMAGEKTVQEVRPTLLAALHQANEQVQKLVGRMKQNELAATEAPAADAEAESSSEDTPVS